MMDKDRIDELLAEHETWLTYHLENAEKAGEVGSPQSQARSITMAAERASIILALKALKS